MKLPRFTVLSKIAILLLLACLILFVAFMTPLLVYLYEPNYFEWSLCAVVGCEMQQCRILLIYLKAYEIASLYNPL